MCTKSSIQVDISRKTLKVIDEHENILVSFPIICGRNSHLGTKECDGDQRTPRGEYYICNVNEKSKFTLFFGISYPGEQDALRAFRESRINRHQLDEILQALKEERRPPWDTPLGGEIGIHGGGIDRDGTRGCVGMREEDILKLKNFIFKGMKVQIS